MTRQQAACLTTAEKRTLDAIIHLTRGGLAPSYGEIAKATGAGRPAVHRHVHALVDLGYLQHTPGEQRSLRVIRYSDIDTAFDALVKQYGEKAVVDYAKAFVCRAAEGKVASCG